MTKTKRDDALHGPGDLEDKFDRALAEGDAEDKRAAYDARVLAAVAGGARSVAFICEKLYPNHNALHSSLRKRNALRVGAAIERLKTTGRFAWAPDGWRVTP